MTTGCICAATLEAWERATPNRRIDSATAAEILRGCELVSTASVPAHHHYSEERIDDSTYECRSCRAAWTNRVFSDAVDGSNPRGYFMPGISRAR